MFSFNTTVLTFPIYCDHVLQRLKIVLIKLGIQFLTFYKEVGSSYPFVDHVFFVHPSTDTSVDKSTDTRPMYWQVVPQKYFGTKIYFSKISGSEVTAECP